MRMMQHAGRVQGVALARGRLNTADGTEDPASTPQRRSRTPLRTPPSTGSPGWGERRSSTSTSPVVGQTRSDSSFYGHLLAGRNRLSHSASSLSAEVVRSQSVVRHWRFNAFMFGAIILNAVQMGLQVDWDGEPYDSVWEVLSHVFTAVFALEMLVKVYFLEFGYFADPWNWLDFLIAWLGIFDTWLLPFVVNGDSSLRFLQSLRLVRMVKLLRMRRELTALVSGLVGSLRSMMWIGILLLLVIYTFGIFCTQVIAMGDYSETPLSSQSYFGSLPSSMLTLFSLCIVDGWGTIVWSLWRVQPFLVPLMMAFLVLTSFGLLNALIGVIVEQTTLATQAMKADMEDEERERKMGDVKQLVNTVMNIDQDNDGTISAAEMKAAQGVPELKELLKKIDLPPGFSMVDLHTMLDQDGNGEVDKAEFIGGMYRLIYCSEFQATCLGQLSMSRTRKAILAVQQETRELVREALTSLRQEMEASLRQQIQLLATAPELLQRAQRGSVAPLPELESLRVRPKALKKPPASKGGKRAAAAMAVPKVSFEEPPTTASGEAAASPKALPTSASPRPEEDSVAAAEVPAAPQLARKKWVSVAAQVALSSSGSSVSSSSSSGPSEARAATELQTL